MKSNRIKDTSSLALNDVRIARATWGFLTEAGDYAATILVNHFGAILALKLLLTAGEQVEKSGNPPPFFIGEWEKPFQRWNLRLQCLNLPQLLKDTAAAKLHILIPSDPQWPFVFEPVATEATATGESNRQVEQFTLDFSSTRTENELKLPPLPVGAGSVQERHCLSPSSPKNQTVSNHYQSGTYFDQGPFCLWVKGDPDVLRPGIKRIALVGARAASNNGLYVAKELGESVARAGYQVVSGGAYGIDIAAHQAAVNISAPTIAVMAGGLDRLYPMMNEKHLLDITTDGALISQYPPGARPARWRFLARNRLIAALSDAVVVIEAGIRSGSLNTARHARDLGKELGAVPGSVIEVGWAGSNQLLRDGATLIRNLRDIQEMVEPLGAVQADYPQKPVRKLDDLDPTHRLVYDALPIRGTASLERLLEVTNLEVTTVLGCLDELVNRGKIRVVQGCWQRMGGSGA